MLKGSKLTSKLNSKTNHQINNKINFKLVAKLLTPFKRLQYLSHDTTNTPANDPTNKTKHSKHLNNKNLRHRYIKPLTVLSGLSLIGASQFACAQVSYQNYNSDTSINYFSDAQAAGKRNDIDSLFQYEQMMGNGLFAMYPAYWRLNNDISNLNPATVAQFARQYSGSVMAEKLTADFAETKARERDYQAIRQVANLIVNADQSEKCAIGLGFNSGGDTMRALSLKPDVWLTTKKQKPLCDQLATEMVSNPMISRNDKIQRLKRMLRVGKVSDILVLTQSLNIPITFEDLSAIQSNTGTFLSQFGSQPYSLKNQYLYLYAIGRIADKSYREAAMQIDFDLRQDNQRARKLLDDSTRRYAYRIIAVKRMNFNTDDGFNIEAVTWFRNSLGESFNYEEAEDYAHAAIRFSQWQDLINAISGMAESTQKEPMWQYWLARAYEQSGSSTKKGLARTIYKGLATKHDYYGFLAKEKLGQRFDVTHHGSRNLPQIPSSDANRVLQNPHFARAFALYNSSASRTFANREWNWAVKRALKNNDHKLIIAAAKRAHDLGWLDRAVYAISLDDKVQNFPLSHPMPFKNSVIRYSTQVGIDPAWAYGIMRQESRFITTARSGVGASGLMQIMPGTAKYIARKLGEPYSASNANNGDTNIRYGTWYMSDILGKSNYHTVVATAGYNAGPGKARRWQPNFGTLATDQYIETIAYPETRNYVKRVTENTIIYSSLLGENKPISHRIRPVPTAQ